MALAFFRQRIGRRTFRLRVDQLSTKTDQNPPGNNDDGDKEEEDEMMIYGPSSQPDTGPCICCHCCTDKDRALTWISFFVMVILLNISVDGVEIIVCITLKVASPTSGYSPSPPRIGPHLARSSHLSKVDNEVLLEFYGGKG